MRNTIILYHPKTYHERNYKFYWIPYSILSIAAPLVKKGYDVRIIDGNVESSINVDSSNLLCVGVSSMIGHQIQDAIDFSRYIKKISDAPIVWGGALPTLLPQLSLDCEYLDFIIRGPGEDLLLKLIESLSQKSPLPDGIGYNRGEKILGQMQTLIDRNIYPEYPFNLIKLPNYIHNDPQISDRVINYISSQGCPFCCSFCSDVALYNGGWSGYSASRTLREVSNLCGNSSANGVKFYDSNFFSNKKRVLDIACGLIQEKADLKWAASAHPKNILSLKDKELELLRNSGLKRILIGAESGVQSELDFINKKIKKEEIALLADKMGKKGIIGSFTFITGFPKMPSENIDITIDFAEKLSENYSIHEFKIHLYLPFPGTPMYQLALKCGFEPPLDLMGWSNLDYYDAETPWIDKRYVPIIKKFNQNHCPYVE